MFYPKINEYDANRREKKNRSEDRKRTQLTADNLSDLLVGCWSKGWWERQRWWQRKRSFTFVSSSERYNCPNPALPLASTLSANSQHANTPEHQRTTNTYLLFRDFRGFLALWSFWGLQEEKKSSVNQRDMRKLLWHLVKVQLFLWDVWARFTLCWWCSSLSTWSQFIAQYWGFQAGPLIFRNIAGKSLLVTISNEKIKHRIN